MKLNTTSRLSEVRTSPSSRRTRLLRLGLLSLSPLLCAACEGTLAARSVPTFRSECVVREDLLKEHPVADRDATNGDLLSEADDNKNELKQCNKDKASVLDLINRQKGAPQ